MGKEPKAPTNPNQMRDIILVSSIAAGVQFGWALQLSLLTPYVQLLGIPHTWSAFIWLCGPVSGLLVQPIVGYFSDHCNSRFGRRRPFIAVGAFMVAFAVFLIGYAADVGHNFGDKVTDTTKPRAVALFVFGFWILDVANNTLQGPCRAFLADLSGGDTRMMSGANAFYSFFMAVGNVLGYAAGSYTHLYKLFPFSKTEACDVYCANLKSCFFISIALLTFVTVVSLSIVREPDNPSSSASTDTDKGKDKVVDEEPKIPVAKHGIPVFGELFSAFKEMPRAMWILFLVTGLNWIAWFPFLLFDTDWMGKEVFGGDVGNKLYDTGVRAGAIGLLINSVVLGFASLGVQPLARAIGGVKRVWGGVNFLLAICLAMTVVITKWAEHSRTYVVGDDGVSYLQMPPDKVKFGALAVFGVLGIPLAATFSIPFALASIYSSSSGAGQGLSLGTLNLAIVIPQMIISMASGPWDALFGGGNLPAFLLGAVSAAISGIFALTLLPNPPSDSIASPSVMGSFH